MGELEKEYRDLVSRYEYVKEIEAQVARSNLLFIQCVRHEAGRVDEIVEDTLALPRCVIDRGLRVVLGGLALALEDTRFDKFKRDDVHTYIEMGTGEPYKVAT